MRLLIALILLSFLQMSCGGDDNPTDSSGDDDPSNWSLTKTDSIQFDGGWGGGPVATSNYLYVGTSANVGNYDSIIVVSVQGGFSVAGRRSGPSRLIGVANGELLSGNSDGDLAIYDISVATNPAWMTSLNTDVVYSHIAGTYLYGTEWFVDTSHVYVCNISNLGSISESMSSIRLYNPLSNLSGNTSRLIASGWQSTLLINLTNPEIPVLASTIPATGDAAVDGAIKENTLYLAERDAGVRLFDISNMASPQYIKSIASVHDSTEFVWVFDTYLTVGDGSLFIVYDISSPTNPSELARINVFGPIQGIAFNGDFFVRATNFSVSRLYRISLDSQ